MIRIGTQNLGLDDTIRAAYLVDDIFDRYALDVLCLQEVYRHPKEGGDDLVQVIRGGFATRYASGLYWHEGPPDVWMINMTISKHPILSAATVPIEDRHLLDTLIATPSGNVRVFNWHAKRQAPCRYNQQAIGYMRLVCQPTDAAYLVGDMNAPVDEIMACGGEGLLRRNPPNYTYSDFFATVGSPPVAHVASMGNEYGLVDAHVLSVATVTVGKKHDVFLPLVER